MQVRVLLRDHMSTEYVRQHDNFRCGPIAIINAAKWAGFPCTYKENVKHLDRVMNCVSPTGSKPATIIPALRTIVEKDFLSVNRQWIKRPKMFLRRLRKHLDSGGSAIINMRWTDEEDQARGHYFLVDTYIDIGGQIEFSSINYFSSKLETIHWVADERMAKDLGKGSSVWWLKRRF